MNRFDFEHPVKVHFGKGTMEKALRKELPSKGKKILFAYGGGSIKSNGTYECIRDILDSLGKTTIDFGGIMSNPTYEKVREGAKIVRENKVDFILAVGGGSVIDCCKALSAQACYEEDLWEMEYENQQMPDRFVPMGAIVTASGTGAEMNCRGIITNQKKHIKGRVYGAYADFAVLDSELTMTVPMSQVLSGAFDTLSHCMETYLGTPRSINVSDEMNEAIMRNVIRNIWAVIKNPEDEFARGELMWDSGLAENEILRLGKVTDFQVHQIEHQLGAYTDCNHGQGLAIIHPVLYEHLYMESVEQFARLAENVWGIENHQKSREELAREGIDALKNFIREIGLPTSLSEIGITDKDILKKVAETSNLTAGCAKKFSREELYDILLECL